MKQVLQDIRSGEVSVYDVPAPMPRDGHVLIDVHHSLISSGTERALATLGSKSMLAKARARPDLVRKVVETARTEGVSTAVEKVRARLDRYSAFGYSVSGAVVDTGGDTRMQPGALVAAVGQGYASHAERDSVPSNLVVPLPDGVTTAEAAFAAPAAIALHAVRLADIGPGSVVAVVGLGLIGQLAGRILHASGVTAVGTDPRSDRRGAFGLAAAEEEVADLVREISRGRGADAVLVTASTPSDAPVRLAAELGRDRARLVVVGDVGLGLERAPLYEKELQLVVARSYGPGRYERAYEEGGLDFPVGHVRWTEGRNVEAVLDLVASGRLRLDDLITHRFPVERGDEAYQALSDDSTALGILLEYADEAPRAARVVIGAGDARSGLLRIALVGAGQFARGTIVPALQAADGVQITAVVAQSGASARSLADKVGAQVAATDWRDAVAADDIDAVVIATPHAEHAEMAAVALEAGKAVFVEKPLAIDVAGLARVAAAGQGVLLVGHNRRFSEHARRVRESLRGPFLITIRVAAGPASAGHWLGDPAQGGRVLGEISHFVDLASYFAGGPPESVSAVDVGESMAATLRLPGGSVATIVYSVTPAPGLAKERVEVLGQNGAAVIDDFSRLELFAGSKPTTVRGRRDKGHAAQFAAWAAAARGVAPLPVTVDEQLRIAAAALALVDSARVGVPVTVSLPA